MEISFEKKAMRGDPLPARLDIADSCLYIALKNLYAMYYKGEISRAEASEDKKTLVYNWETDKSKIEFLDRENYVLKNRIQEASENYKNNPCVKNADKLYAAFYNLSDDWRTNNTM